VGGIKFCDPSNLQSASTAMLADIVAAHKRGNAIGIYSVCSAHPFVLEAAIRQALDDGSPLLVESTSNQVNQEGGYTGRTPADFGGRVCDLAEQLGLPRERVLLGGDHLGPNPWRSQPARLAMSKACTLVRDCVLAGYVKIHLDASMRCADDPPHSPLDPSVMAERTADLCLSAEEAYSASRSGQATPVYVIGTEVPPPGGAEEHEGKVTVTAVDDVRETIERTRMVFTRHGLDAVWERVIAVVVQPGIEFGDELLLTYDRQAAARLARFVEADPRLVFEAHSTDYQTRDVLRALVEDHFAILKVGPALTFAFREAIFALAQIETEWLSGREWVELSGIGEVLEKAMLANPLYWRDYYAGPESHLRFARKYSYSDRSRYYWPVPEVESAVARLLHNLEQYPAPLVVLSQFLPVQYERVRTGALANRPRELVYDKIRTVLADYAYACGHRDRPRVHGTAPAMAQME
jgi:D-tagatose-1,6-bisphosphate aldolase subunit GatZ/KbaZ